MKKKNKKNQIRMRFSKILLCILAILLCAAPRGWAVIYDDGGEHDVTEDVVGCLEIGTDTTVNLYASVSQYVYVYPGSILNIYSGSVGWYIAISPDEPYAVVTVYGTDFGGEGDFSVPGQVSYSGGILTGIYGNGDPIELEFYSNIPVLLVTSGLLEVEIDIKPGGNPNNINLKSKGVVPVAILSTETFNASNVDPESVTFTGASHVRWTLCDVDDDGDDDMLFHFKTQELLKSENNPDGLDKDSTKATLTATLIDTRTSTMTIGTTGGEVIQGTDEVRIVSGKK